MGMGLILNAISPLLHLAGASPLPLDVGYLFLVGSNIFQSTVVQQRVGVLTGEDERIHGEQKLDIKQRQSYREIDSLRNRDEIPW